MSLRMRKINQELRRRLMEIVQQEIDDPNIEFLSITSVDTTRDLSESKVYFSLLNDKNLEKVRRTLENMKRVIRMSLGKKIRLKKLPDLTFLPDESLKYSVEINKKIEEIRNGEEDA